MSDSPAAASRIRADALQAVIAATPDNIREEMADVTMCLMMAAEIAGFDLLDAVLEKIIINEKRQWTVDAEGCLHHVKGSDPRESSGISRCMNGG